MRQPCIRNEFSGGRVDQRNGRRRRLCSRNRAPLTGSTALLVVTLALGLLGVPRAGDAQPLRKIVRIGVLANVPPSTPEIARNWEAFRGGLRDLGWIDGQNLTIEYRWAAGQIDRFPALAAELVGRNPDLLVVVSTPGAQAAKQATRTIPVVFVYVSDAVGTELVASLAQPGGNVTGQAFMVGQDIVGKHLQLLKEVVPTLARVGVLMYPDTSTAAYLRVAQVAGHALDVKLQVVEVQRPNDLEAAFAAMTREHAGAFLVLPHALSFAQRRQIAELAAKSHLPAVYPYREFVEAGGLMAYGANAPDMFRRAATYVDRILKGAKPADLPVEQPTQFELVLNLKTAKAFGLTITQSLLLRADEVIQ